MMHQRFKMRCALAYVREEVDFRSSIRISVAMGTYNGAQFLYEQLESLASQQTLPLELVVCDDDSQDATLDILSDFASSAPFPVHVHRNEHRLGFTKNFLRAASLCIGEWVSFCDQDDVWLPNKLSNAANAIVRYKEANLILQKAHVCDENLSKAGTLFPTGFAAGAYGPRKIYGFWLWPGFLQTVRRELLNLSVNTTLPPNYDSGMRLQSHDKWVCMLGNSLGGVVILAPASALYRRHRRTVSNSGGARSMRQRVKKSISVGASRYRFLEQVAIACGNHLREIAVTSNREDWRKMLRASAVAFDRLAGVQARRATIHGSRSILTRTRHFGSLLIRGGYVGPTFVASGWKSAAKDVLAVFTPSLLRRMRNFGNGKN